MSAMIIKVTVLLLTATIGVTAESLETLAPRMACYDETTALHCYNMEFDVRIVRSVSL